MTDRWTLPERWVVTNERWTMTSERPWYRRQGLVVILAFLVFQMALVVLYLSRSHSESANPYQQIDTESATPVLAASYLRTIRKVDQAAGQTDAVVVPLGSSDGVILDLTKEAARPGTTAVPGAQATPDNSSSAPGGTAPSTAAATPTDPATTSPPTSGPPTTGPSSAVAPTTEPPTTAPAITAPATTAPATTLAGSIDLTTTTQPTTVSSGPTTTTATTTTVGSWVSFVTIPPTTLWVTIPTIGNPVWSIQPPVTKP